MKSAFVVLFSIVFFALFLIFFDGDLGRPDTSEMRFEAMVTGGMANADGYVTPLSTENSISMKKFEADLEDIPKISDIDWPGGVCLTEEDVRELYAGIEGDALEAVVELVMKEGVKC